MKYLPEGIRLTHLWPAADGWQVLYLPVLPIPEWESYPVIAWALLETPQGQRLAGVYVKRASVEVELGGLEFLGYQKPGEMLADSEIKKAAMRRVKSHVDQFIADREKTLANPPPGALTDAQIAIWEEGFRASLSALDLPPHVQSRIANHLRHSKPSHHSPRVQFVAEVMKVDQYPYGWVTRLYTFDEWCQRVGDPDLGEICIPKCRLNAQERADVVRQVRAYLNTNREARIE